MKQLLCKSFTVLLFAKADYLANTQNLIHCENFNVAIHSLALPLPSQCGLYMCCNCTVFSPAFFNRGVHYVSAANTGTHTPLSESGNPWAIGKYRYLKHM